MESNTTWEVHPIASLYLEIVMNQTSLKRDINEIIFNSIYYGMEPWWFITFHYKDHKTKEAEILEDIHDLKNKLKRLIYKNRDPKVIGIGKFYYPKCLFINERSRWGTEQFHTHMILERLPSKINTQASVETLFKKDLPARIKAMSKWKRVDVQRVSTEYCDLQRLSRYLAKQNSFDTITIDLFNSDL